MSVQTISTPSGDELVVITRAEYEDLVDASDHAAAMAAYRGGDDPGLTDAEMDGYLAATSPLVFWRKRRGLTQTALAEAAGLSQAYLAQIETGKRVGDVGVLARIARRLGVRIEDLIADPS